MLNHPHLTLFIAGLIAGFIGSIAGGSGLITIPTLCLFLALGPKAVGTNKLASLVLALISLAVYSFQSHMNWKRGWLFTFFVALGSFLGSSFAPSLPPVVFRGFLIVTCPLILWTLWKKHLWISKRNTPTSYLTTYCLTASLGFACGLYDGIWGAGGATFMFMSLFFGAKFPMLTALAISKLANLTSACISLLNYSLQKNVDWDLGPWLVIGISLGSLSGASLASRKLETLVRPTLLFVVSLLLLRVLIRSAPF